MLGKNNTSLLIQKSAVRKSQFAIKKLSVGVVSVAVGSLLSLGVSSVQAEEVVESDVVLIQDTALIENLHEDELKIAENLMEEEKVSEATNTSATDETLLNHPLIDEILSADEPVVSYSNENLVLEEDEADETDIKTEELVSENHKDFESESHSEAAVQIEETSLDEIDNELSIILDEEVKESSEPLIVEEIDNDAKLSSLEAQEAQEALSLSTNKVDIIPPKIISISPGQEFFTGNETRNIFVKIEEANRVNNLNIRFLNLQLLDDSSYYDKRNYFDFYYYDNGEALIRNNSGNYVLELINNDNYRYGQHPGDYQLSNVYTEDNMGNTSNEIGNVSSSFDYLEYEGQDFTDPVLKDISTDKEIYHAGEQVEISILVEEDKALNNVSLSFNNEGYFGPNSFDLYMSETSTIKEISQGLFEFKEIFTLPDEMGPTTYTLNWLSLNDLHLYDSEDTFPDVSLKVINDAVKEVTTEYETSYTTSWQDVSHGSNGLKFVLEDGTERIIHEVVHEVKMYDHQDLIIDYETILVENYDSYHYGGHSRLQYGQSGSKTVYYDINGNIVEEHIHSEAINEMIMVDLVGHENIEPETIYIANPDLEIGSSYPSSDCSYGLKKVIYDLQGNIVSEEIISESLPRVIEVGSFEYITIPYEINYEYDDNRIAGSVWDEVIEYGSNGQMKLIYDLSGNVIEEVVVTPAVNSIIKTGTIQLTPIPYDIVYTYWKEEVRQGREGAKYIFPDGSEYIEYSPTTEIRLYDGELVDIPYETQYTTWSYDVREGYVGQKFVFADGSEIVFNESQNKVVLYNYEEVVIEHAIEYVYNYNEFVGYEVVLQEGKDGLGRKFLTPEDDPNEYPIEYITSPITKVIEIGILTNVLIEEREADPLIKNTITLIDYDTGYSLDSIKLSGDAYSERLNEFINKFNEQYGVSIEYYYWKNIKETKDKEFINAEYVTETHRDIEIYIKNHSEKDLRDIDYPLAPFGFKIEEPSTAYMQLPQSNVKIIHNNDILLDLSFITNDLKVYPLVEKLAELIDKERYLYDTAYIYNALITMDGKSILGTQFDIHVKERLQKQLVSASYQTDYTNNPNEVRSGQNGTKYIYSDGSERFVERPINEIVLIDTPLENTSVVDSITVDKNSYAINDQVEVTITGRSQSAIEDLVIHFSDWSVLKTFYLEGRMSKENLSFKDGQFVAKVMIDVKDYFKNSHFSFDNIRLKDVYGKENNYSTLLEFDADTNTQLIIDEPFQVGFQTTNVTFLGIAPVDFKTEYTTNEQLVREGQTGSKLVYSDGSEVILTKAISEILLYDNEIAEIEPETEYTIYAHEVRAGIKGSKLVFSNGEEKILDAPVSAVALYRSKVEEFDYSTVTVESSNLAFGERHVIQEGIVGRRVVFYNNDGSVVDSLVVSAPISRIEQIGANKQTLVLIPFDTQYTTDQTAVRSGQNGTRYIYSDGREETLTQPISAVQLYRYADEVVAYQDVVHENSLLATGQTNVLTQGSEGLNRVFYDQNGKVVEVHTITQVVNRVFEVGTLEETSIDNQPIPSPVIPQPDRDEESVPEVPVPDSDSDSDSGTDDDDANTSTPDTDSNEDNNSTNEDDINGLDEDNTEEIESVDVDSKEDEDNGNPSPSLPSEKDELDTITPSISLNAASLLPNTGEHTQTVWLTLSALSLLTGLGLVIKGKRKQE